MVKSLSVPLLSVLLSCGVVQGQQAASMFRGGAAHPGVYDPLPGRTIAGLQWRFATQGAVSAAPTVAGQTVYVGSGDGRLYALDLLNGQERWHFDAHSPIASTAAAAHGLIYFATRGGTLHAVNAEGRSAWQGALGADLPLVWGHENGDFYTLSPAIVQDLVVIASGSGRVFALDARSGQERWHYDTNVRVRTSPAVANGLVYIGAHDGRLYALDLATGALRWKFETLGVTLNSANFGFDRKTIQSSPAVANGAVYFGARDGLLYALDAVTGARRWSFDHKVSWVNTPPAVSDGMVYDGSSDAHFVQAVDARTGSEVWRFAGAANVVWGGPAVAGDQVIAPDFSGWLYGLDRRNGELLWRFGVRAAIHSGPVVANGLILFGSADGSVYALRVAAGPPVARAVFFDSAYRKAAWHSNPEATLRLLLRMGYQQLDRTALESFLRARIADQQPSVVVFAIDHLPPGIADGEPKQTVLRQYLERGAKVVWTGIPPGLWPRNAETGSPGDMSGIRWNAPSELLGFSFERTIFGPRGVHATRTGARWGLTGWWLDAWGVKPDQVTEVLGLDEEGLAGAWVKNYGGPPGTGFVRAPADDPYAIYLVAEYRPAVPAGAPFGGRGSGRGSERGGPLTAGRGAGHHDPAYTDLTARDYFTCFRVPPALRPAARGTAVRPAPAPSPAPAPAPSPAPASNGAERAVTRSATRPLDQHD